ncbi:MAG: DNA-directed RNA polymerase subunit beta [Candidatus Bipolaricaulia bacterium]
MKQRERRSYGRIVEMLEPPHLLEPQLSSHRRFQQEGIRELFDEIFPVERGELRLELADPYLGEPHNKEEECRDKNLTYSRPLRAKARLFKDDQLVKEEDLYLADIPMMTQQGTFIINGSDNVIISQLVRSPGVYLTIEAEKRAVIKYKGHILPYSGSWLELTLDTGRKRIQANLDRKGKVPITTLLRALGMGSDEEIMTRYSFKLNPINQSKLESYLGYRVSQPISVDSQVVLDRGETLTEENLDAVLGTEPTEIHLVNRYIQNALDEDKTDSEEAALKHIYKEMRPADRIPTQRAREHLNRMFFNPKTYFLSEVGRFKLIKKLYPLIGDTLSRLQEIVNLIQGQDRERRVGDADDLLKTLERSQKVLTALYDNDLKTIEADVSIRHADTLNFTARYVQEFVQSLYARGLIDQESITGVTDELQNAKDHLEAAQRSRAGSAKAGEHLDDAGRSISRVTKLLVIVTVLVKEDIFRMLDLLLRVPDDPRLLDEKDHLANKRVKTAGEAAQDQLGLGLRRMADVTKDRLGRYDGGSIRDLVTTRTVQAILNRLFYTGRTSQFLEQTNPLAELTHKRRLTALGGGLSRKQAKLEVRDVHRSHYARICPIETPEGQNIGLITTIANYARINPYGFLESPYRRVKNGRVTDRIEYLMADEEERYRIASPTAKIDKRGRLIDEQVEIRTGKEEIQFVSPKEVDFIEISPKAVFGVSASLIPFLEHDDANRALMGSNMQRQAVPLVRTEAPYVETGMEGQAARNSGLLVIAARAGVVERVDAKRIEIRTEDGAFDTYKLLTFNRSNQDTLLHQKPIVDVGDHIQAGDVLADGPSSDLGDLALGANVLVGFLPYEGYNYEDAIVISERLVKDDALDSVRIQEYEITAEETELGPEEITADIPNVRKEDLANLDDRGIIRVGTEVKTGDILVGKITPKGEEEPTPEEKIFRSIFGEKSRNIKNTSLKLPPTTEGGKVIAIKQFSRERGDQLDIGVNELVKAYVAQRKKISMGDKIAGRHGNKGVVAKIFPEEDMPFLPDGTPLDVLLNPLSVPSRMNLGQVFETHLGWLAQLTGTFMISPVFDGAKEEEILNELHQMRVEHGLDAGDGQRDPEGKPDGKVTLWDGRTGEPFASPVVVGSMYLMKLEHIAEEKLHARSTGPYSLVTQQPLGGKAQFGGQRLGEMEVWALEAYGAAYTLQEMLTLKSDNTRGRVQLYKAILKGEQFPEPGISESFKALVRELRSLGLDLRAYDKSNQELSLD